MPAGHILDAKNDTTTSVDSVEKENQTSSMDTWKRERKLKFSYKEQKEYETIEDDIAALEQKIEELDAQTLKFSSDFVKLNEITKEKNRQNNCSKRKWSAGNIWRIWRQRSPDSNKKYKTLIFMHKL